MELNTLTGVGIEKNNYVICGIYFIISTLNLINFYFLSQCFFIQCFFSQYGFWPLNYLSVNQFVDDIITSFENKQYTVVVFLDISMAFDKWL